MRVGGERVYFLQPAERKCQARCILLKLLHAWAAVNSQLKKILTDGQNSQLNKKFNKPKNDVRPW